MSRNVRIWCWGFCFLNALGLLAGWCWSEPPLPTESSELVLKNVGTTSWLVSGFLAEPSRSVSLFLRIDDEEGPLGIRVRPHDFPFLVCTRVDPVDEESSLLRIVVSVDGSDSDPLSGNVEVVLISGIFNPEWASRPVCDQTDQTAGLCWQSWVFTENREPLCPLVLK